MELFSISNSALFRVSSTKEIFKKTTEKNPYFLIGYNHDSRSMSYKYFNLLANLKNFRA